MKSVVYYLIPFLARDGFCLVSMQQSVDMKFIGYSLIPFLGVDDGFCLLYINIIIRVESRRNMHLLISLLQSLYEW
jgi:hypothetical protein